MGVGVEGVEAREERPEVGSLALYWPVLGLAQRGLGKISRKETAEIWASCFSNRLASLIGVCEVFSTAFCFAAF